MRVRKYTGLLPHSHSFTHSQVVLSNDYFKKFLCVHIMWVHFIYGGSYFEPYEFVFSLVLPFETLPVIERNSWGSNEKKKHLSEGETRKTSSQTFVGCFVGVGFPIYSTCFLSFPIREDFMFREIGPDFISIDLLELVGRCFWFVSKTSYQQNDSFNTGRRWRIVSPQLWCFCHGETKYPTYKSWIFYLVLLFCTWACVPRSSHLCC